MGARIREAKPDDADKVVECNQAVWESLRGLIPDAMWNEGLTELRDEDRIRDLKRRFREAVEKGELTMFLAEVDGEVVGVIRGRMRGGVFHLDFLGVKPMFRRRGIGLRLLEATIEKARTLGAHKVSLYTVPTLKEAIRLYVRAGFVPEAFLKSHWYKADFIVYSKFLS